MAYRGEGSGHTLVETGYGKYPLTNNICDTRNDIRERWYTRNNIRERFPPIPLVFCGVFPGWSFPGSCLVIAYKDASEGESEGVNEGMSDDMREMWVRV